MARTKLALERRRAFGRNLRELRREAGWSQEDLGDRSGLHRTYVGSVERGERNIALDAIWQIADALGVEPGDLIHPKSESNSARQ